MQKITFAKGKSDAVAMKEGSIEPRYKRQKREEKQKEKLVSDGVATCHAWMEACGLACVIHAVKTTKAHG